MDVGSIRTTNVIFGTVANHPGAPRVESAIGGIRRDLKHFQLRFAHAHNTGHDALIYSVEDTAPASDVKLACRPIRNDNGLPTRVMKVSKAFDTC
jgi:hypothetical protein